MLKEMKVFQDMAFKFFRGWGGGGFLRLFNFGKLDTNFVKLLCKVESNFKKVEFNFAKLNFNFPK